MNIANGEEKESGSCVSVKKLIVVLAVYFKGLFCTAGLTRLAYRQKPQLVSRHVLPVVWHHVSAKTPIKGEARLALQELCAVLQDCMQQGFLDSAAHLSVEDSKKLKELLDWDGSSR